MEAWRQGLYHHGIKGQRWGVKNGPPYPLSASDHSVSEKKAGWRNSLRYTGSEREKTDHKNAIKTSLIRKGAEIVAACMWAIGEYPLNSRDDLRRIGEYAVRRKIGPIDGYDSATGFKLKRQNTTMLDDAKALNPSGDKNNCMVCSMAYDLRRRGFDVSAAPVNDFGLNLSDISKCYKNIRWDTFTPVKSNREDSFTQFQKQITQNGEGSRGILTGKYLSGGGHAIAWEVRNERVVFVDGQIGKIFDDPYSELFSRFNELSLSYARLDDLELNMNRISGFIQDS